MQARMNTTAGKSRPSGPPVHPLARVAVLLAFAVAAVAMIAAPLLAIQWSRQPFPGFLVEQSLVVQPVLNKNWSGVQAGIAYPQRIVRAAAQPLASAADLASVLAVHDTGEQILIFARFPDGKQQIYPVIEVAAFPFADFLRIFWLPYVVGAVYLGIGIWIYRLRGNTRPGSTLALFCIVTALTSALLFDTMTTHVLTAVWLVALAMVGGTLIELGLRFPEEWGAVTRRPWLSFLPFVISLLFAAWALLALFFPTGPWSYLPPRQASFRYASIGIMVFLAIMLYRARQGSSLLVRRQARLVTIGSVIAFTPAMLWLVLPMFGFSVEFDPALFLPALLVFPISVGWAILRFRLWEVDSFVNHAFVYGLLTAGLAGVFAAMITFTQRMFLAVTGEQSDAAILITTLIVAATFTPLKAAIEGFVTRQFRDTYDQTRDLRSYGKQVHDFVVMSDARNITRKLLEESVRTLKAQSGAVGLAVDGQVEIVHTVGPWRGDSRMSVNLNCDRHCHGVLLLGPPQPGHRYDRQEVDALQQVANQIGEAVCIAMPRCKAS